MKGYTRVLSTGLVFLYFYSAFSFAQNQDEQIKALVTKVSPKVVSWRRDIHQNPELGNRETRTAALVAAHLRELGMEVTTGVAHTGVVGLLKGGKPGPVVGLRADMDALPVVEKTDVPFASKVRTNYNGQEVGVMHACGHDAHTAILMGVAEVLQGMQKDLHGSVKFIFQPAEEGPPKGEEGGATMMIAEGVLDNPKPDAMFALHAFTQPKGVLAYRAGGIMAGADGLHITVEGRQTHGGVPWAGADPIVVASQIVLALQLIPSRQIKITAPVVISIGSIHGGLRGNIIPAKVEMEGTIRILDPSVRDEVLQRIRQTATNIAESSGTKAVVTITRYAPVNYNDPALTARMLPTLKRVAGAGLKEVPPVMPSEDFAFFQEKIPGLYFFLGINAENVTQKEAATNHSPYFYINEDALPLGVKALSTLAVDFLNKYN